MPKPPDLDEQGRPVTSAVSRPPDIPADFGEIQISPEQMEHAGGEATAITQAARGVPAVGRGIAGVAARHPAAVQKLLGAGFTVGASSAGGAVGGVPGALAGGMIRGVTPTQAGIRETAGRLAGEAPEVARQGGRAVGVANFAKETAGLKLNPSNVISTGNPARAVDNFADSMGQKIVRIFGPDGRVEIGPEAYKPQPKPGFLRTTAVKGAGAVGRGLAAVSGPMAMTDFAQTVEPNRRDIGVMGIGRSVEVPGAHPPALNQLRDYILAKLGY